MTGALEPPVARWVADRLPVDVEQSLARLAALPDAARLAVMPDCHLASEVCVGVVLATRTRIYPAAVGSDLGCGMAAVRFDASGDLLADEGRAARLLAGLYERVPANRRRRGSCPVSLPGELEERPLSQAAFETEKRRDGLVQFGTLGRGNHFVELQADEEDRLWLMVHSGSRGLGQRLADWHAQRAAQVAEHAPRGPAGIEADSPAGRDYLADLAWAMDYAAASRLAIVDAVAELLADLFGAAIDRETLVHGNHNHVRQETHFGEALWVHRKGALSAGEGEPGVIPGSMGSNSFHVAGRGHPPAMASCSHGAGRAMSRGEAARAIRTADLHRQMQGVWFDHRRARALCDEAPQAYKEIHEVMRAQRELVRIVRKLRPLLSYKGA